MNTPQFMNLTAPYHSLQVVDQTGTSPGPQYQTQSLTQQGRNKTPTKPVTLPSTHQEWKRDAKPHSNKRIFDETPEQKFHNDIHSSVMLTQSNYRDDTNNQITSNNNNNNENVRYSTPNRIQQPRVELPIFYAVHSDKLHDSHNTRSSQDKSQQQQYKNPNAEYASIQNISIQQIAIPQDYGQIQDRNRSRQEQIQESTLVGPNQPKQNSQQVLPLKLQKHDQSVQDMDNEELKIRLSERQQKDQAEAHRDEIFLQSLIVQLKKQNLTIIDREEQLREKNKENELLNKRLEAAETMIRTLNKSIKKQEQIVNEEIHLTSKEHLAEEIQKLRSQLSEKEKDLESILVKLNGLQELYQKEIQGLHQKGLDNGQRQSEKIGEQELIIKELRQQSQSHDDERNQKNEELNQLKRDQYHHSYTLKETQLGNQHLKDQLNKIILQFKDISQTDTALESGMAELTQENKSLQYQYQSLRGQNQILGDDIQLLEVDLERYKILVEVQRQDQQSYETQIEHLKKQVMELQSITFHHQRQEDQERLNLSEHLVEILQRRHSDLEDEENKQSNDNLEHLQTLVIKKREQMKSFQYLCYDLLEQNQ